MLGEPGSVGNGHGAPRSFHTPGSDETEVSHRKALPVSTQISSQTTQSITAEEPEGSCPREEKAMFTMKKTRGNASKQTGKTQFKVKLMINVT